MKLTLRQKKMVSAFLKEVDKEVGDLSAADRAQALATVKAKLQRELPAASERDLGDADVAAALRRCRTVSGAAVAVPAPSKRVASQEPKPAARAVVPIAVAASPGEIGRSAGSDTRPAHPLGSPDRRWLGVCLYLAGRLGSSVLLVRALFVCLGLAGWPLALALYAGSYFVIYALSPGEAKPAVSSSHLLKTVLGTLLAALVLYVGTRGALWSMGAGFEQFMSQDLRLGTWGWLATYQDRMLAGITVLLVPIAILSALPMLNDWDQSWKKVVQAGLALYGVVLAVGIGSSVAGVLLLVIDEFVG